MVSSACREPEWFYNRKLTNRVEFDSVEMGIRHRRVVLTETRSATGGIRVPNIATVHPNYKLALHSFVDAICDKSLWRMRLSIVPSHPLPDAPKSVQLSTLQKIENKDAVSVPDTVKYTVTVPLGARKFQESGEQRASLEFVVNLRDCPKGLRMYKFRQIPPNVDTDQCRRDLNNRTRSADKQERWKKPVDATQTKNLTQEIEWSFLVSTFTEAPRTYKIAPGSRELNVERVAAPP
ncbi:hypothetical protein K474DRAFT_1697966 [Panus rudis PR-1116 ss-1]|nr:hypothetical protein K474DRAFT_1697966 [Panus rudis PR-1116 ss-1]